MEEFISTVCLEDLRHKKKSLMWKGNTQENEL